MKKVLFILLSLMLLVALAACGGEETSNSNDKQQNDNQQNDSSTDKEEPKTTESSFPDKPITVTVSYSAGGGTDVGARILIPYVEEALGVPINIVNKPGGGGWIGWTYLANADPDGYTVGYINTPNFMTGYLDPKFNRKENLDSFDPIANHVKDPGAIAIRVDEDRFTNIEELIEYAKENELTATSTGVGSDDHYASLKLNHSFDTKFTAVHNKGAADSRAAVLGGHIDVLFANVGEVTTLHQNEEIKVIAVMNNKRSEFLPDVPTLEDAGYEGVYSWSARGIAAPKGVDPEKFEILRAAFEKGIKNAEQVEKMGEMGLQVEYSDGEDYMKLLKDDEEGVIKLKELLGW